MKKIETTLTTGTPERPYCAFPSLAETEEGILCAYKTGVEHYADEGQIRFMLLDKAGSVLKDEVLSAVPGYNAQNVELLTMPDGTVQAHVDIQDYHNEKLRKSRVGSIVYEYRNGTFELLDGKLTDKNGTVYGYVFDGTEFGGRYVMAVITFKELTPDNPRQTVQLLATDDNGHTWEEVADVSGCTGDLINESSLCVYDGKLYIAIRPMQKEYMYFAVFDSAYNMVQLKKLDRTDGVEGIGRPKLFLRDGSMYMIIRNRILTDRPMRLDLLKINTETLTPEKFTVLDDAVTGDGYYAEQYFDGEDFCVITYRYNENGSAPDIVHIRYSWDEVK